MKNFLNFDFYILNISTLLFLENYLDEWIEAYKKFNPSNCKDEKFWSDVYLEIEEGAYKKFAMKISGKKD